MPDLVTHTAFAYLARNRKWNVHSLLLLIFGAMLPDLLTRPFMAFFPDYTYFFHTFHTPFCLLLIIFMLSVCFEPGEQLKAFAMISLGTLSHLLLDFFQFSVHERSYCWLFPFSYSDYQLGLFLTEDSLFVAPYLAILVLVDYFVTEKKFHNLNEKIKRFKNGKKA